MEKFVLEEGMLLTDVAVFGDNDEHEYKVKCFDGHAIAERAEESNAPHTLRLTYPTLAEVKADEDLAEEVLDYRGLYDLTAEDITFGDVCMYLGEITQ